LPLFTRVHTWGPANVVETSLVGDTTCYFFSQAFGSGLLYKSDISLAVFSCNYSAVSSDDPLTIEFDISASFKKSTGFNPYTNCRLPTADELNSSAKVLVEGNGAAGPYGPTLMSSIQEKTTGPYTSVTGFSLQ